MESTHGTNLSRAASTEQSFDDKPSRAGRVGALALASATLTACGGGGSGTGSPSDAPVQGPPTGAPAVAMPPSTDPQKDAARFLLHASLSSTMSEIAAVEALGKAGWLDEVMDRPNDETAREYFARNGFDQANEDRHWDRSRTGDYMIWSQLLSGGNPVRKRVALALSEFFVVSLSDLEIRWPAIAIGAYWDLLNEHAFGNYRELLEAVTLNPAMAQYLDTIGNQKADPVSGREPDENFAREILQLFSIGLVELNLDGSLKGSMGSPIETYTNEDVTGLARCFTGFHYDYSGTVFKEYDVAPWPLEDPNFLYASITPDPTKWRAPANESYHSLEEKRFLGATIPAGTGPLATLQLALDTIFEHPNVAPFFCRQMIQRLVTSNPSPEYVRRVAMVFEDNGNSVRGDLRAVFRAILLDDEANDVSNSETATFGRMSEPMLRFVQWGRTFSARSTSGHWEIDALPRSNDQLGQSALRSPSVFNFFRPNFTRPNSEVAKNGLLAPEFQLVNETSVVGYANFMELMIEGRSYNGRDLEVGYPEEIALADDPQALVDHLNLVLTARSASAYTTNLIVGAVENLALRGEQDQSGRVNRVKAAVFLFMITPEFIIRK